MNRKCFYIGVLVLTGLHPERLPGAAPATEAPAAAGARQLKRRPLEAPVMTRRPRDQAAWKLATAEPPTNADEGRSFLAPKSAGHCRRHRSRRWLIGL
jgi:hypothetical protein